MAQTRAGRAAPQPFRGHVLRGGDRHRGRCRERLHQTLVLRAELGALFEPVERVQHPERLAAMEQRHIQPRPRLDGGGVLIAATAQENPGVGVLHDDTDFNDLATVMDFQPVRFLPEGEKRAEVTEPDR